MMKYTTIILLLILAACTVQQIADESKTVLITNSGNSGLPLTVELTKGKAWNNPSLAVWLETLDGEYIETLYVTRFVATGSYGHGELSPGKWSSEPGTARRPAALPYWSHKRNIRASDNLYTPSPETAVPDALTGATPKGSFALKSVAIKSSSSKYRILVEVNQPWDSNLFWTNNKFPDDNNYVNSLQPSLVYAVTISPETTSEALFLNPIGHGDPSGASGKLFTDLTTITTAKEIFNSIVFYSK